MEISLNGALEEILKGWSESEAAARVDAVESMAMVHGAESYNGVTIPQFIVAVIDRYTQFLMENPHLIGCVRADDEPMKKLLSNFLEVEEAKVLEADRLNTLLQGYFLGPFDPRWIFTKRKYDKVVNSFQLRNNGN